MIDTHIHFWSYQAIDYAWISDEMPMLKQDRLPEHIVPLAQDLGVVAGMAVQARCNVAENAFLLNLAKENQWIKGIIGWLDLRSGSLKDDLAQFEHEPLMKGFRHIVQDEPNPAAYWSDQLFRDGVKFIQKQGFVYDLLCHQKDLGAVVDFARAIDDNWLILDHLGKPELGTTGAFDDWKSHLNQLAKLPHVAVKISGLVTECGVHCSVDDIRPYVATALDLFGDGRVLFGSDWSVCTLTHDYQKVFDLFCATTHHFRQPENPFTENAKKIYGIEWTD